MKPFARILVPIDFSDESTAALTMAGQLAEQSGGELLLTHILEMPSDFVEDLDLTPPTRLTEGQQLERFTQELDELAKRVLPSAVRWSTLFEIGKPAAMIVAIAEREKVDLIVMSTTGRNAVVQLLIGSVAERVVRLATCPVMTLRKTRG